MSASLKHKKPRRTKDEATTEWTFGITDVPPSSWKRSEPLWDERLSATNRHTFHQVVQELCATAIKSRREYDWDINEHLWELKIVSPEYRPKDPLQRLYDSESSDAENSQRPVIVMDGLGDSLGDSENESLKISSSTRLDPTLLPEGHIVDVTYDYGSTTKLYLKVLSIRPASARSLLTCFQDLGDAEQNERDLQSVPAYHLPKDKQIDAYYPNFSKACLGHYVPPQEGMRYYGNRETANGSITIGLSSRIRSEKDTTFCSMENATCSSDLLFCSLPMDMNELLAVCEQAWTPRKAENDPDDLSGYDYESILRTVFSSDPEHGERYEYFANLLKSPDAEILWGPKRLIYRRKATDPLPDFDFAKVFPKTAAHFGSGRFRWFKYKKQVLRVIVGRGTGPDHRGFTANQVLRTWKQKFASFHELLCAVEASWVTPGSNQPLDADTVLQDFDLDLGPSDPGPKEPPLLGKESDAVIVSKTNDEKKLVTALAITEEDGKAILYSGHDDGTLVKWSLENNIKIWSKQLYPDATSDFRRCKNVFHVRETPGVAGLVVRSNPLKPGQHLLYTWSDNFEGYLDWELRAPSEIKVWCGNDGSFQKSYSCDIGNDQKRKPANPCVACVVFCRLVVKDRWIDSMIVGLHCNGAAVDWEGNYEDFDFELAAEAGEGNILPFYEHSSKGQAMETWREHRGIIRAMAVIPDKYLLSLSIRNGHGSPDAMVLWDLRQPGVPLCRHDFWDPSRSLFKQDRSRLYAECGISVSGTNVLIACEYGDRIAVVTVEDPNGDPCLQLHGYGNIGHRYYDCAEDWNGSMSFCGKYAVMSNDGAPDAWLFAIEESKSHPQLDHREGPKRYFRDQDDAEEESKMEYAGREIAVGKVSFPLWGGNPPVKEETQSPSSRPFGMWSSWDDSPRDNSTFLNRRVKIGPGGSGGPLKMALRGKWLVAGFANGSIARAPFLPDEFETPLPPDAGSNSMASCSWLTSDEWPCPILESRAVYYDDDDG